VFRGRTQIAPINADPERRPGKASHVEKQFGRASLWRVLYLTRSQTGCESLRGDPAANQFVFCVDQRNLRPATLLSLCGPYLSPITSFAMVCSCINEVPS
jgi:hypothetical protein